MVYRETAYLERAYSRLRVGQYSRSSECLIGLNSPRRIFLIANCFKSLSSSVATRALASGTYGVFETGSWPDIDGMDPKCPPQSETRAMGTLLIKRSTNTLENNPPLLENPYKPRIGCSLLSHRANPRFSKHETPVSTQNPRDVSQNNATTNTPQKKKDASEHALSFPCPSSRNLLTQTKTPTAAKRKKSLKKKKKLAQLHASFPFPWHTTRAHVRPPRGSQGANQTAVVVTPAAFSHYREKTDSSDKAFSREAS
jgi:hypothetical protein